MLGVVRYMHSCGVCHRDLKLENWLFDIGPDPKPPVRCCIVDVGLRHRRGAISMAWQCQFITATEPAY